MILYTFPVHTAFIDRDLEMIQPVAEIKPLEFTQSRSNSRFSLFFSFFNCFGIHPRPHNTSVFLEAIIVSCRFGLGEYLEKNAPFRLEERIVSICPKSAIETSERNGFERLRSIHLKTVRSFCPWPKPW